MATVAHCLYCFETLWSSLERRKQLSLSQTEEIWDKYLDVADKYASETSARSEQASRAAVGKSSPNRNSSTQSSASSSSMSVASSTKPSASSSLSSISAVFGGPREPSHQEDSPMFITWNLVHPRNGQRSLRGCIGTFEAQKLERGLNTYALTAALEDTRFMPISFSELPSLECGVTLLTSFEPASDPMDWEIGKHGIRISFYWNGRRYGATYLPDVAKEQGWDKDETMVSLMRKAGWNGRRDDWLRSVQDLKVIRYQGKKVAIEYETWSAWRNWAKQEGLVR